MRTKGGELKAMINNETLKARLYAISCEIDYNILSRIDDKEVVRKLDKISGALTALSLDGEEHVREALAFLAKGLDREQWLDLKERIS